ncbi:MAG: PAS domain S-box protein, partial [Ferruginibacter sp.]|nr:PAS domain S-box protein [Ferruginibacter sp.]
MSSIKSDFYGFNAFFENASIGIVTMNGSGNIVSVNPFLLNLFGCQEVDLINKKFEILFPVRFRLNNKSLMEEYLRHSKNHSLGVTHKLLGLKKNGTEFSVELHLSSYLRHNKKFLVAFVNSYGKRNKNQAELYMNDHKTTHNSTKNLSGLSKPQLQQNGFDVNQTISTAYQKAILDHAGVMLFVTNSKGVIQFFNQEAEKITGYQSEEVVGIITPEVFFFKDELERFRKELQREFGIDTKKDKEIIIQKAKKDQFREMECRFIKKDGTIFPVITTVTVIYENKRKINGYLGVCLDITQHKKAELKLVDALKKEKKLNELKT